MSIELKLYLTLVITTFAWYGLMALTINFELLPKKTLVWFVTLWLCISSLSMGVILTAITAHNLSWLK